MISPYVVRVDFPALDALVAYLNGVQLVDIDARLSQLLEKDGQIMSALSDLNTAYTRLNTSISAEIQAVSDKIASLGGAVSAADAAALVSTLNALSDKVDAETASLTGTAPVNPPPGP